MTEWLPVGSPARLATVADPPHSAGSPLPSALRVQVKLLRLLRSSRIFSRMEEDMRISYGCGAAGAAYPPSLRPFSLPLCERAFFLVPRSRAHSPRACSLAPSLVSGR